MSAMNQLLAPATKVFKLGRFGPRVDPTGAQVFWNGKLWDVVGAAYRETPAAFCLQLRSFNREIVALAPMSACQVLVREYDGV